MTVPCRLVIHSADRNSTGRPSASPHAKPSKTPLAESSDTISPSVILTRSTCRLAFTTSECRSRVHSRYRSGSSVETYTDEHTDGGTEGSESAPESGGEQANESEVARTEETEAEPEKSDETEANEDAIQALGDVAEDRELSDADSLQEVVAAVANATAEARAAADDARDAAEQARAAVETSSATDDGADAPGSQPHALSLNVELDADSEDLEQIVRGIRQGLLIEN